jgi:hypothetical protein
MGIRGVYNMYTDIIRVCSRLEREETIVGSEEEEETKRLRERIKFCKDGIKEREREGGVRESREKLVSLKSELFHEYSSAEKGVETLVSNNHSLLKTSTLASLSACLCNFPLCTLFSSLKTSRNITLVPPGTLWF